MPKVSIIVPVYNVEKYIKETVKSIQEQTIKEIEIILVDDGSTDRSGVICDELKEQDARIKVIHQENSGVSSARNRGMDIATGDFIGFADADDLMKKDMYETLYKNAINNKVDLSMVSPVIITLKGKEKYFNNTKKQYIWTSEEALENLFKRDVFNIAVYTKLLHKDLAEKIRFEEGRAIHEDKFFTYQAIKNAEKIFFDDASKYIYIKRENSASTAKFSKKKLDAVYFANKIFNDVSLSSNKELIKKAYVDTYITKLLILRGMYRDKDAKKEFTTQKQELIEDIKTIDLKKYKNEFSKQKVIEIYVIQKFTILYNFMVKIFDILFR